MIDDDRAYVVRRSGDQAAHVVHAESPEAAAVAWLEIVDAVDGDVKIVVRPQDGHDEHCFILDGATGQARDC